MDGTCTSLFVDEKEIERLCALMQSDCMGRGVQRVEFESRMAAYCGARYCAAVSSASAALYLAGLAIGLGPGRSAITSPLSFVGTANSMRHTNAAIEFVDIDPGTWTMSPDRLEEKLADDLERGIQHHVVVPVDFAGQSCDMEAIRGVADRFGLSILEDAGFALGGDYQGRKVGCCENSDITVFGLDRAKSITTGDGGLVLTNERALFERIKSLCDHGLVTGDGLKDRSIGPWHVEMQTEGFGGKLSDFQCFLGVSQLARLDRVIQKRRALAAIYEAGLADLPVTFQVRLQDSESARGYFPVLFDFDTLGVSKRLFYDRMRKEGVGLALHYYPVHLHPFYRDLGFGPGDFPATESFHEKAFSLPLDTGMEEQEIRRICAYVKKAAPAPMQGVVP